MRTRPSTVSASLITSANGGYFGISVREALEPDAGVLDFSEPEVWTAAPVALISSAARAIENAQVRANEKVTNGRRERFIKSHLQKRKVRRGQCQWRGSGRSGKALPTGFIIT